MKEALTKFVLSKKRVKNRVYFSPRIYIPTKLANDSSFPFKGEEVPVLVKIKGKKLIIQKATKKILAKYGYANSVEK
ncbi:hypothetical protein DRO53_03985 [Candidatus Bathyarchaeota archaeon]|nr:MAG: hypothetical protein DRO46_03155 [Candidatus Hecatellales archaeon]RLI34267.1 MAG: hypothetical protein DRO53_03985 [Candidatus Bathyarchaeota archaeon]